jgi:hypothetical protein
MRSASSTSCLATSINGILISADSASDFPFEAWKLVGMEGIGGVLRGWADDGDWLVFEGNDVSLRGIKYATLDRRGRTATPMMCSFKLHL